MKENNKIKVSLESIKSRTGSKGVPSIREITLCLDHNCSEYVEAEQGVIPHYHMFLYVGEANAQESFEEIKNMTERDFPGWQLNRRIS